MRKTRKLNIVKIISNCKYMIIYAFKLNPLYYSILLITSILVKATEGIVLILIIKDVVYFISNDTYLSNILYKLIIYCIILTINLIAECMIRRYSEIKSSEMLGKFQNNLMKKALSIDLIEFDNSDTYDNIIRATEKGSEQVINCIFYIIEIISHIVCAFGIIGIILTMKPIMALFPIFSFVMCSLTLYFANKIKYQIQSEIDPINRKKYYSRRVFYEPDYAKELRLTNIGEVLINQFNNSINEERETIKRHGFKLSIYSLLNYIVGWAICVFYLPAIYLSYNIIVSKRIKIHELATMYNANLDVTYVLNDMTWKTLDLQKVGLYGEYFRQFMDTGENIELRDGIKINQKEPKTIEFRNVSFSYDNERLVLKNINLKINEGEKIAIVGSNGAGKSTLAKLLLNLYNVQSGQILYDGRDINEYNVSEYRKIFGCIFQDFQIYADTLATNVIMDNATDEDQEKIYDALKFSDIFERVKKMDKGIQTLLTKEFDESGTNLSGGERQKIAIARIYVRKHPVLILDEPSSSLDPIAENQFNKKIFEIMKKNTAIFISHRLTTTQFVDRIIYLENGEIAEIGTHDELMKLNKKYAYMYKLQAKNYINECDLQES